MVLFSEHKAVVLLQEAHRNEVISAKGCEEVVKFRVGSRLEGGYWGCW